MAKKKFKFHKKFIWIPGAAIAGVLVAVFVFGFGLDFVNPLYEEPSTLTVDEAEQNNQIIFDSKKNFDPNDICFIGADTNCDGELDEMEIEQGLNQTEIIDDPPIMNGTFTEDPPIDQVCDELDLGCGTRTLTLTSIVTKTDSSGLETVVEETFDVGQLAFFVEDISGIDFATGRVSIELIVEGEIGQDILGFGEMDVLIRGESVLPNPVIITPVLISDGIVQLKFGSALSDNFLISIADHFDKFLNEQVSRLSFVTTFRIDEAVIQEVICDPSGCSAFEGDTGESFGVTDLKVFSMDIARDDQRIIVINEGGIEERIFPSDSRIVLSSVSNTITANSCLVYRCTQACGSCPATCTGPGPGAKCPDETGANSAEGDPKKSWTSGTVPPPTINGVTLIDSEGKLIASGGGSGASFFDFAQLTRNQNYTLSINSPSVSSILIYGKTQETQSYQCWQHAEPIYTTQHACSDTFCVFKLVQTWTRVPNGGLTLGSLECALP